MAEDLEQGAFPASEDTPGQRESRSARQRFLTQRESCPWWEDYLALRSEGWDWRKASFIAWSASPVLSRWPESQEDLAQQVLGLKSDRTIRKWREKDPTIGERIASLQIEPLMRHRRDVIDALIKVSSQPDPKAAADRKVFLEMTGDYKPRGVVALTGEDGGPVRVARDLSDEELQAIAAAGLAAGGSAGAAGT